MTKSRDYNIKYKKGKEQTMDITEYGELEDEVKVLDLTEEDIKRIEKVVFELGGKKVSQYNRRIRTLDNGTSDDLDQLLRITEEEGHTKLSLHIGQSNPENKKHIKIHLPQSDRLINLLAARYNESVITDTAATRISYEIGDIEENCIDLDIDKFSAIPPLLEIDCANLFKHGYNLKTFLEKLQLQNHKVVKAGTEDIHLMYGVDYFSAYSTQKGNEERKI